MKNDNKMTDSTGIGGPYQSPETGLQGHPDPRRIYFPQKD